MSKKFGIIFISIGVVLILSALLLFAYNMKEDENASKISEDFLADVKSEIMGAMDTEGITDVTSTNPSTGVGNQTDDSEIVTDMPSVNIRGYDFIGYISIPHLNVELPVMSEWDYAKLDMAPCRQAGSVETDDLVIAAHNYRAHFANLESVGVGGEVFFTNMNGDTVEYRVTEMRVLDGNAVEDVINSGHDLVLYTCTYEGTTRVVLFCDRAD